MHPQTHQHNHGSQFFHVSYTKMEPPPTLLTLPSSCICLILSSLDAPMMERVAATCAHFRHQAEITLRRRAPKRGQLLSYTDHQAIPRGFSSRAAHLAWLEYIAPMLHHTDSTVRHKAVRMFGRLNPHALTQHISFLLRKLNDTDWSVRDEALHVLGKLGQNALAQHGLAISHMLHDNHATVRYTAIRTLGKLNPTMLARRADTIVHTMQHDTTPAVRTAAAAILGHLNAAELAKYADRLLLMLDNDINENVRCAAVATMAKMHPPDFAKFALHISQKLVQQVQHAQPTPPSITITVAILEAFRLQPMALALTLHASTVVNILNMLHHDAWQVRIGAIHTLSEGNRTLTKHAREITYMLADAKHEVRYAAAKALTNLEPSALTHHTDAIMSSIDHTNEGVRLSALYVLGHIEVPQLAVVSGRIAQRLHDSCGDVRYTALELLGMLRHDQLVQHAHAIRQFTNHTDPEVRRVAMIAMEKEQHAPAPTAHGLGFLLDDIEQRVYGQSASLDITFTARIQQLEYDFGVNCTPYHTDTPFSPSSPIERLKIILQH